MAICRKQKIGSEDFEGQPSSTDWAFDPWVCTLQNYIPRIQADVSGKFLPTFVITLSLVLSDVQFKHYRY